MDWFSLIIGITIGDLMGIAIMSLMQMAGKLDREEEQEQEKRDREQNEKYKD